MPSLPEYAQPRLTPNPAQILADAGLLIAKRTNEIFFANREAIVRYFDEANRETLIRKEADPEGTHSYTNTDISIFEAVWSLDPLTMRRLCQEDPLTMAQAVRYIPDDWWTTSYENDSIQFPYLQYLCESFPPNTPEAQQVLEDTLRRMRNSAGEKNEILPGLLNLRIRDFIIYYKKLWSNKIKECENRTLQRIMTNSYDLIWKLLI